MNSQHRTARVSGLNVQHRTARVSKRTLGPFLYVPILILLGLVTPAAKAQLTVSVVSGTTETPLTDGGTFLIGQTAVGDTTSIQLRLRNTSSTAISITRFFALGSGFVLIAPSLPFGLLSGSSRDVILNFTPTATSGYSANLEVNTFTSQLLATGVPPLELTVLPTCTIGNDSHSFLFGNVQKGQARTCGFNLRNPNTSAMTVTNFTLIGSEFTTAQPVTTPFTLGGGQTLSFSVQFKTTTVGVKTTALIIQAQSFTFTASSFDAPLPTPVLDFFSTPTGGTASMTSGQQVYVGMHLPSPATFTTTGVLTMTLIPDSPLVKDDRAIVFLGTSLTSVAFAITQGSTTVTLSGQPSLGFQTGTTSGRIRFTLSAIASGFATDPTTDFIIPRAPVHLDLTETGKTSGLLFVKLTGYDNSYSTGPMSFAFYDANGGIIQTVPADFSKDFQTFYQATQTGSLFYASLQFNVNSADAVASVEVTLTNAAGNTQSSRINF